VIQNWYLTESSPCVIGRLSPVELVCRVPLKLPVAIIDEEFMSVIFRVHVRPIVE
jgi:hypothetical protein